MNIHAYQFFMVAIEGRVQFTQQGFGRLILDTGNNAVRFHKVIDGHAFGQEFRVGSNTEG